MKPTVSVIMPSYNATDTIERAILSVFAQTFSDWELIVVDDCSDDKSYEFVSQFEHPNLVILRTKSNLGPAGARNVAIRRAKGKFIAILDADDVMLSTRLEKQVKFLRANKDVFLVFSGSYVMDESGRTVAKMKALARGFEKTLRYFNPIVHASVMFRNDGTLYDQTFRLCEDYEFYVRAVSEGKKIASMKDFLVRYTEHEYSKQKKADFLRAGLRVKSRLM